jgi:predicted AAA+ superfamily ATPase
MDLLQRKLQQVIEDRIFKGKAIILVGARQVGKSTLFRQILTGKQDVLTLNCDDAEVREMLTNINRGELQRIIGNHRIVMVDEAQRVQGIGLAMKLITDNMPDVQLLITGSSSLMLQGSLNEPLTGRKFEYHLYPFSTQELVENMGLLRAKSLLESRLVFGSYPDVINDSGNTQEILMNLSGSYMYQDLLSMEGVRKPVLIEKLLVALALQVGSEVSYNELAQTVGSDAKTVEKYIDLLEKCYVLFRLPALSRNLRSELKRGKKIYFYDNGVRNALIGDYKPLELRNDTGALWENYIIAERLKHNAYNSFYGKSYFWRTQQQQEIDYIEDIDGVLHTYEFKWNNSKHPRLTDTFAKNYPNHTFTVVSPENYQSFVKGEI